MNVFTRLASALLAGGCVAHAAPDFSGQVRPEWVDQRLGSQGPLARAAALQPGIVDLPRSGPAVETELHASGYGFAGSATLRQQRLAGEGFRSEAFVDELYYADGGASWQFSAGKRIVAWDVGYAFRPNDVVEQEVRRTLLSVTPEGRPLLMAEHFDATTAWSFVLVNPTHDRVARYAQEPALAMRVYRRDGAVDWHGFARYAERTGASLGAAAAWVASDAVELHASLRWLRAADSRAFSGAAGTLVRTDPWVDARIRHPLQALVGGTWTNDEQLSLLAEAWWDGTALTDARWNDWNGRNRALMALDGGPAPAVGVAGNLAWQASALDASASLRRANLFLRASWTHDKWQPALDMLYTPADAGRVVTGSVGWQGDRLRFDAGLRVFGGPGGAVLAQTPVKRIGYVAATWPF
jgi:hypothetical protein